MCKHIHLVCRGIEEEVGNVEACANDGSEYENERLIIEENPTKTETEAIVAEISRNKQSDSNSGLLQRKEKTTQKFLELLNSLSTLEEIDIFDKIMASVQPTLCAVRENKSNFLPVSNKQEPPNKNIVPQRMKLKSTIKKKGKKKSEMCNPSRKEAFKLSLSLLQRKTGEEN